MKNSCANFAGNFFTIFFIVMRSQLNFFPDCPDPDKKIFSRSHHNEKSPRNGLETIP